jgi:nitrite reductase [NAD(P)H] small subunit
MTPLAEADVKHETAADAAFVAICRLADIPLPGARVVRRPGDPDGDVALFRTANDRVFAVRDRCPHRGGPLSQGIVFGDRVACPLHNWTIDLASGCAAAPDCGAVRTFATRVDGGIVHVALGDEGA